MGRATIRGGIALSLAVGAITACDAAPEIPRTGTGSATESSEPVATSSPKVPGDAPVVEPSLEEMVLLRALDRAGLTEVGVPEHGGPGDAWAAGRMLFGGTGVLHSNRDRIMTPGKVVEELRVDGVPAEVRDTATFGLVLVLDCRDFALGVATLDGLTPTRNREKAVDLARTVLPHLPC